MVTLPAQLLVTNPQRLKVSHDNEQTIKLLRYCSSYRYSSQIRIKQLFFLMSYQLQLFHNANRLGRDVIYNMCVVLARIYIAFKCFSLFVDLLHVKKQCNTLESLIFLYIYAALLTRDTFSLQRCQLYAHPISKVDESLS